jgi:hypothetical protein
MPFLLPLIGVVVEWLPALLIGAAVATVIDSLNDAANARTAAEARRHLARVHDEDTEALRRVYFARWHEMSPGVRREFEAVLSARGAL